MMCRMEGMIKCPKCNVGLGELSILGEAVAICPQCLKEIKVFAFPALYRKLPPSANHSGEIAIEGDSTCFFHPQKKAAVPCDGCGRFLCALCDIEFSGQHLCSTCLEAGVKKKSIQSLEKSRKLDARRAFMLSLLPLFITGPVAVFMAIRAWKAPGSIINHKKWYAPVALTLGAIQSVFLIIFIIALFLK